MTHSASGSAAIAPPYIKVCGMTQPDNLTAVADLQPDFLGFIFYPKSARYVGEKLTQQELAQLPSHIRKVGVFVNESVAGIRERVGALGLDMVQLHGHETPANCAALRAASIPVIKAFGVGSEFDFASLRPYEPHVDYFLFDTYGPQPGGNGTAFNWSLLAAYPLAVPYFLAGGLDLKHAEALRNLHLPGLYALDLNSRFETAPGVKDPHKLRQMLAELRA